MSAKPSLVNKEWRFGLKITNIGSKINPMNLSEELRKLAELHSEGHLTPVEFAEAKARLIAQVGATPTAAPSPTEGNAPIAAPIVAPAATLQMEEKTYKSSRWSAGNLFFPDKLTLASDGIIFKKGALFGSDEEHINYRTIASFRITNGIFLSNICIETSGGSQPIFVNGLWKSAAKEIQDTIRSFQKLGASILAK